jgi:PleD family two-component response regulator
MEDGIVAEASRVLIVEDQPSTAEMLASYFENQGYQVTAVAWGEDALEVAGDLTPDVVVLDIRLPDIDGYEVFRRLRAHRRTQHVPIIFLTEKKQHEEKLRGLELGAVDYLTKPFDIEELRLRVRYALDHANVQPSLDPTTGLPAQPASDQRLRALLGTAGWAVLSVGVGGLKQFSEAYGFVARDDVLRAVALMVGRIVEDTCDRDAFVGHLDETNLFAVGSRQKMEVVQRAFKTRLSETKSFFYPSTDWKAKRTSAGVKWPKLVVATGMLDSGDGPFEALDDLKRALLEVQREVA